jgi:hypothetical protein
MPEPMRALTVKQPWAFGICHGKDVENRSWQPPVWLGPLAIHAGARSGWDPAGELSPLITRAFCGRFGVGKAVHLNRRTDEMAFSAIVAVAEVRTCHHDGRCYLFPKFDEESGRCSPWAVRDEWHWQLSDVRVLAHPVPCKGMLGLWRLPDGVEKAVREQLSEVTRG